ncbi:hypothetical protein DSCOOX_15950 [Desulfosarcina ovata subsp. ovata]|uniref:Uncharacterized protein n=1 Tax=Desulfosarcina ovata subsp. ovata TaxID=2752305 RepID=A0A5K8A7B5_9BACT|nr:hypothetical protein DSCOOX_15950 [Desulfosarcina ovata subsp. ovata]
MVGLDLSMCREYQNRIKRLDDMLVPAIAAKGELHDKLVAIQSSFKSSEDNLEKQRSFFHQNMMGGNFSSNRC